MSEKKKLLILIVVMVVLIGGAGLLYTALGDSVKMPGLVVQDGVVGSQADEMNSESDGVGSSSAVSVEKEPGNVEPADTGASEGQANAESGEDNENSEETRELAPDFTVYDVDGNAHKLSDFRGKPVVVNFWASWCGPCKSEMPDFQEVYETYGEEVHFLMVNMTDGAQETVKSASEFVAGNGYTFPVYYDTDMDATYTYGVYSIPTTYFFDAEGHGIAYGQGAMDKDTILTGIGMILE